MAIRLLPGRRSSKIQLPIYGRHGVGVDAGAVRWPDRRVRSASADGGLAARHLRALLAAGGLHPIALHVVPLHSAPTLSNGILSPYKHLTMKRSYAPPGGPHLGKDTAGSIL